MLGFAAVTSAYRGETALTKARAEEAIALAARTGYGLAVGWASWALAILALSQDDPLAADTALAPLAAPFEDHIPEPIRRVLRPGRDRSPYRAGPPGPGRGPDRGIRGGGRAA